MELYPGKGEHEGDQEFTHTTIEDVFPKEQVHVWDPLGLVASSGDGEKTVDISAQQLEAEYTEDAMG